MQNELENRSRAALQLGFENLAHFARQADKPTCPRCVTCGIRVPDDVTWSGAGLADLGAAQESKQPSSHDGREQEKSRRAQEKSRRTQEQSRRPQEFRAQMEQSRRLRLQEPSRRPTGDTLD